MSYRGARPTVELLAWWVLLFLLYLVFIGSVSALELAVGAGVSGLAAAGGRSTALRCRTRVRQATGWQRCGSGRAPCWWRRSGWPG